VGLIGFLMVSTWRFWSGKEINLSRRHPVRWIVLLALVIWLLVFFSRVVLLVLAFVYMFSGIVARAAYGRQRRKASQADALNPSPTATPQ
jgi:CDP-diacylglycerol---serine O-phosphatidyltransferase